MHIFEELSALYVLRYYEVVVVVSQQFVYLDDVGVKDVAQNFNFVLEQLIPWLPLGAADLFHDFGGVLKFRFLANGQPNFSKAALANHLAERVKAGDAADLLEPVKLFPRRARLLQDFMLNRIRKLVIK